MTPRARLAWGMALAASLLMAPLSARAAGPNGLEALAIPPGEALARLQALLRLDTTNPPGHETAAAALVAGWLRESGVTDVQVYEAAPGRSNVVARLHGRGTQRPLLLLNHLDVVTADARHWQHPPFAGRVENGVVWGRGAFDMKGLGVMEFEAFLALARRHVTLDRDVIFCAVADEEAGGQWGAQWLLAHHPEAVACSDLLNEGGAGFTTPSGVPLMGISVAERGLLWVRVTARGRPGHGSVDRPDGATRRLLHALARIEAAPRPLAPIPETRRMFETMARFERGATAWGLRMLAQPWLASWVAPRALAAEPGLATLLGDTWNTTVLAAGEKVNVVPGTASADIDCRILPGHTVAGTLAALRGVLADPGLELTVLAQREPSRSPAEGPFYRALLAAIAREYPAAHALPVLTPGGGTDSAFFRQHGVRAFGLMPIMATRAQLDAMHGDNEFITVAQLEAGTRVVAAAVRAATTRP